MRTFINCVTKITGIGFGQVRVVVKVPDERRAVLRSIWPCGKTMGI